MDMLWNVFFLLFDLSEIVVHLYLTLTSAVAGSLSLSEL